MANRSLNKVMLIGNLTRDPELRYTPSGVAVCTFGLATNRSWNDSQGNPQEATEFHRIVAWGKLAELCSQLLFKGRKAFLEGRLQTRDWTGQDGAKRTTTEIVIDSMLILDRRMREEAAEEATQMAPKEAPAAADDQTEEEEEKEEKKAKPAKKEAVKKKAKTEKKEPAAKEEVKPEDIPF